MSFLRWAAAAAAVALAVTGCTSSAHKPRPSTPAPSSPARGATCTPANAAPATTVSISAGRLTPSCVKLARGKALSIVNTGDRAVQGSLLPPSKKRLVVQLPHKNSVYPFTTKKPGTYVFSCTGCADSLRIFVS